MKGELSCGAQRTVVVFKPENPMSENVNTDLGHWRMPTSAT